MPFEISIEREFAAAHQIRLHDGTLEPLHGHNWRVCVTVAADNPDAIGTVMDFHALGRLVDVLLEPRHNRNLNDVPALHDMNPTAENVARHVAEHLELHDKSVTLVMVSVTEAPGCTAVYRP